MIFCFVDILDFVLFMFCFTLILSRTVCTLNCILVMRLRLPFNNRIHLLRLI